MRAILAPDVKLASSSLRTTPVEVPTSVHIAAHVCHNYIRLNHREQLLRLERRVQEETHRKSEALRTVQRWTRTRIAVYAIVGLLLAAGLPFLLASAVKPTSGLQIGLVIAFTTLLSTAVIIGWTIKQSKARQEEAEKLFDGAVAQLGLLQRQLPPISLRCPRRVWWALQLTRPSDEMVVPLVLARAGEVRPSDIVRQPIQQLQSNPDEKVAGEREDDRFIRALQGLSQLQAQVESWPLVRNAARLPVIPGDHQQGQLLIRELTELLNVPPVQLVGPDLLVLGGNASLAKLEGVLLKEAAIWEACCKNRVAWKSQLRRLRERAKLACGGALREYQQDARQLVATDEGRRAPLTDWLNLADQRPDVKALLDNLKKQQAELEREVLGGIEYAAWQELLTALRNASLEFTDTPWRNSAGSVEELKRAFGSVGAKLASIDSKLQDFLRVTRQLSAERNALGNRELTRQIDLALQFAQKTQQQIDQWLRSLGELTAESRRSTAELSGIHNQISQAKAVGATSPSTGPDPERVLLFQQLAAEVETRSRLKANIDVTTTNILQGLTALRQGTDRLGVELKQLDGSLQALDDTSTDLGRKVDSNQKSVNDYVREVDKLSGRAETVISTLERELVQRQEAVRRHDQRMRQIDLSYEDQVKHAKADAEKRKNQMEHRLRQVAWLTDDPESLIAELTGFDKSAVMDLTSFPLLTAVQDVLSKNVQDVVVKEGYDRVSNACEDRDKVIDAAYHQVQRALMVPSSSNMDAELLLVPLWYVEWSELEDLERPDKEHSCYRLVAPFRLAPSDNNTVISFPLYPGLEQYMKIDLSVGMWGGSFPSNNPSANSIAANLRRCASEESAETEAFWSGIQELAKAGIYDQFVQDVMVQSRNNYALEDPKAAEEIGQAGRISLNHGETATC